MANFSYKRKINIATIIYLHRISIWQDSNNLRVLASLCGKKAMSNVIIATTMWNRVKEEIGARWEQQLQREFWKDMVADGCQIERFENSYDSAWRVVNSSAEKEKVALLLPREIVDGHLRLGETEACIALNGGLLKLIKEQKEMARSLLEQAGYQNNGLVVQELNERRAEIEEKIRQTADQLHQLKIPFTRRVRLFFKGHHG
jgi:hypothetical protein